MSNRTAQPFPLPSDGTICAPIYSGYKLTDLSKDSRGGIQDVEHLSFKLIQRNTSEETETKSSGVSEDMLLP